MPVVAEHAGVAAAVDRDHEAVVGLVVLAAGCGYAGASAARADPDVVLVVLAGASAPLQPVARRLRHQRVPTAPGTPGIVFEVQATSESTTPGTVSPITAAAWAIRWSA